MSAVLLLPSSSRSASFPPRLHFRSIALPRVIVYFHEGLEPLARRAATLATEILEHHEARYHVVVRKRLAIVVSDVSDDPNGFTTPFPYPLISIRAASPDGSDTFGNYDTWLRLVLTHELAHSVHLEEAHGLPNAARKILGRAPFLFPNALTPTWMVEGLATYEETRGTAFGRGRSTDVQMVVRMAALEGPFPGEDQAVAGFDSWPVGDTAYFFGESFLDYLTRTYGDTTLPELARTHSSQPFPFLDEFTAEKVTGLSFSSLWREWHALETASASKISDRVLAEGQTSGTPLTERGIRQMGPRFSPDGEWIAYSSETLDRFPSIHLVRTDGTSDHALVDRNGGTGLSWTPDGRFLIFDEPDVYRLFSVHYDLKKVDVRTGKVSRLTHGARARFPDVAPNGNAVVFVRLLAEESELSIYEFGKGVTRDLTHSPLGTRWGEPHWHPNGDKVVASRFLPGGFLDIVLVDVETGEIRELTHDRARDVEPVFSRDGASVIFRSDRDGISNLYAVDLTSGSLLRLTNVVGGAFDPDVSPEGSRIAFSSYSSRGYDVEITDLESLPEKPVDAPFVDSLPPPAQDPEPASVPVGPYHPIPFLLPRYWSPTLETVNGEWRYGVFTGSNDPLAQHAYLLEVLRGTATNRTDAFVVYQYDRFWPTFSIAAQDISDPEAGGAFVRSREVDLGVGLPVQRSFRMAQAFSLTWRRKREELENVQTPARLDLGGLEVGYDLTSAKAYPYSISPIDGFRLHVGYLVEDPTFGGQVSLGKLTMDSRGYLRLGSDSVLALRAGGGTTFGHPRFVQSYAVGGFPEGTLSDVIDTNFTVLRGYPDDAFVGRSFVHANAELRFPLFLPERGYRSIPILLRHLHGAVFVDAANAWVGQFRIADLHPGVGAALGLDLALSQGYPLTLTSGVARGLSGSGVTTFYVRLGVAF